MSERPYMKFYVSDFLGDTLQLDTEEIGAYALLLMAMWNAGGNLPADEKSLCKITRLSARKWHRVAPAVLDFFERESGVLTNHRLSKELQKFDEKRTKLGNAAKAGGRASALKRLQAGQPKGTPNSNHTRVHSHNGSITEPLKASAPSVAEEAQASFLPEPESEKPPEKKQAKTSKAAPDVEAFKSEIGKVLDPERVEALCAVRRKKGAVFSQRAGNLLLAALTACPSPTVAADEMVLRNWTSVKPEWLDRTYSQPGRGPPTKSEFRRHQDAVQDDIDRALGRKSDARDNNDNGEFVDLDRREYFRNH